MCAGQRRTREQQSRGCSREHAGSRAGMGTWMGYSLARGVIGRSWDGGCSQHLHRLRRDTAPVQRVPASALRVGPRQPHQSTRRTDLRIEPHSTRRVPLPAQGPPTSKSYALSKSHMPSPSGAGVRAAHWPRRPHKLDVQHRATFNKLKRDAVSCRHVEQRPPVSKGYPACRSDRRRQTVRKPKSNSRARPVWTLGGPSLN